MAGRLTEATQALLAITPASAQHTECACFSAACQPCSAKTDNTIARWTFFFLRCNKGRNEHFFQNLSRINSNLNVRAFSSVKNNRMFKNSTFFSMDKTQLSFKKDSKLFPNILKYYYSLFEASLNSCPAEQNEFHLLRATKWK